MYLLPVNFRSKLPHVLIRYILYLFKLFVRINCESTLYTIKIVIYHSFYRTIMYIKIFLILIFNFSTRMYCNEATLHN